MRTCIHGHLQPPSSPACGRPSFCGCGAGALSPTMCHLLPHCLQLTGQMPVNKDVLMSFPRMRIIDMSCEFIHAAVLAAACVCLRASGCSSRKVSAALHLVLPTPRCCNTPPAGAVNKFRGGLPPGWGMKNTVPNMELM